MQGLFFVRRPVAMTSSSGYKQGMGGKGAEGTAAPASGLRGWVNREPLQAATLAGTLVYGSFRLDYFVFYGSFGVTPEEVGHGYVSTLARALVGGLFVFVCIFAVMFVIAAFLGGLWAVTVSMFKRRGKRAAIEVSLVAAAGFASAWFFLPHSRPTSESARVVGSIFFAGGLWIVYSLIFKDVVADWNPRQVGSGVRRLMVPVSVATALVVFFVLMPLAASQDAKAVRAGYARRAQFAGFLSLPWGGDIVYVDWADATPPSALEDECVMYLGRSPGVVVLWDPLDDEVHRLPEAKVLLTSPDDEEICEP